MTRTYDPASDMPDYTRWVDAAGARVAFGPADYLHAQVVRGAVGADLIGALVMWAWPRFIVIDDVVMLSGAEKKYADLRSQNLPTQEIQYWCNFTNIDGMLPGLSTAFTSHLATTLRDMWEAKLRADFPQMKFDVRMVAGETAGEISLTFFHVGPD